MIHTCKTEVTENEKINEMCDTADDSLFVGGDDFGGIYTDKILKEVV